MKTCFDRLHERVYWNWGGGGGGAACGHLHAKRAFYYSIDGNLNVKLRRFGTRNYALKGFLNSYTCTSIHSLMAHDHSRPLMLMLRLHLPRASYDLFVYDFPYGFQASWE